MYGLPVHNGVLFGDLRERLRNFERQSEAESDAAEIERLMREAHMREQRRLTNQAMMSRAMHHGLLPPANYDDDDDDDNDEYGSDVDTDDDSDVDLEAIRNSADDVLRMLFRR